jgi:hypothetical protein
MPAWGLDPVVYGPLEERSEQGLGHDRCRSLVSRGEQMTHEALIDPTDAW